MPILYTVDIPKPTDQISQSQGQLRNNNNALNEWVNVNHGSFNTANFGKHKFVEFPVGSAQTTIAGEVGLWAATSAFSGNPALFFSPANTAGGFDISTSGRQIYTTPIPGIFTAGGSWVRFPSGVLYKWGNFTGAGPYNFQTLDLAGNAIPAFVNAPDIVMVTAVDPTTSVTVISANNLLVSVNLVGGTKFSYIAIGR